MITTTSETIPKKKIDKILGIVKGNTVRARWFGRDIAAGLKQLIGGEIKSYTEMLTKAREEALERMLKEAKDLGADAIINVRFTTSQIMPQAAEILAYGTAVKLS